MAAAMQAHRYDLQYQLCRWHCNRYLRHRMANTTMNAISAASSISLRGVDSERPQQGILPPRPGRRR